MKLKCKFDFVELDGQYMAVPTDKAIFGSMLRLNDTAADILKLLENDTDENKINAEILKKYSGDSREIAQYIHSYIENLKELEVLDF